MNSNIFIRYSFGVPKSVDEFDLSDLGKSLIGFEKLCKQLEIITKINGNVSIQAQGLREGSLIIDVLIKLEDVDHLAPFDQFEYLLEFLQLASSQYYQVALNYFQQISSKNKSVEDFLREHPLGTIGLAGLYSAALVELINLAKMLKSRPLKAGEITSERVENELNKLINNNKSFRLTLQPLIDDKVSSIEVINGSEFYKQALIDDNNLGAYLRKEDQILPALEDGEQYRLVGRITSLKSTRGDSLTFRYHDKKKIYSLDLFPKHGETTKQYINYYLEDVNIKAEVIRTSLYKKPKLRLINISLRQLSMFTPPMNESRKEHHLKNLSKK